MDSRKLTALFVIAGAGVAMAQQQPQLTARELFYVPVGIKAAAAPAPKKTATQAKSAPVKKEPSQQQVAVKQPVEPVTAPEARPKPPRPSLPDGVQLMTVAHYKGPDPLGLRYSVLKRMDDRTWEEVPTDSVFHSGDRIRVRVESNEDAYLYIVMRGSSGNWRVLFPSAEINGGDNHVEAMQPQMVPSGNGVFTFDAQKGEEKLFLVLSRTEVPDLENLIYDLNAASRPPAKKSAAPASAPKKAPAGPEHEAAPKQMMLAQNMSPIDDALVGRLRTQMLSRDLVFEKVDDAKAPSSGAGKGETAVYVVEKSGKPDARLIADIKLVHQ